MKKKIGLIALSSLVGIILILTVLFLIYQGEGLKTYNQSNSKIESISNTDTITVMSSNVRVYSPEDTFQKSWFYRAPYIKQNIIDTNPDIISFQEVGRIHMGYLTKILEDYDYIIKYRDLNPLGEGCPIFYKKDKFNLINKGYFWLSDTPDKMSKDKDAACYRICSYVILEDKATLKQLVVFNTHLDHVSDEARIRGINLVLSKIEEFGFNDKASLLMGDMNDYVGSTTINALFNVFDDGYTKAINKNGISSNHTTYQGYGKSSLDRIDFFGVSKKGIVVNSYNCINKTYKDDKYDTIYPSDHNAIVINITLE